MADLQPIQFKRSSTPNSVPTSSQLLVGELAINLADGVIYTKNDSDKVFALASFYDSDIRLIHHNYKAADSDTLIDIGVILDSDLPRIRHDYRSADSELLVYVQGILDSDLPNIKHDFKAADSELLVYVQNILDSDLPKIVHDFLSTDSEIKLSNLRDVVPGATHGNILAWDSDTEEWKPIEHTLYSTPQIARDSVFITSDSDISWPVYNEPKSRPMGFRNGIALPDGSLEYDPDTGLVTYDQAFNENSPLEFGDTIIIEYIYTSSVQSGTRLGDLWNVDRTANTPLHDDVLSWDSDIKKWVSAPSAIYTPSTPSDWSGTPPSTFGEALDRLAAVVKALNSNVGA